MVLLLIGAGSFAATSRSIWKRVLIAGVAVIVLAVITVADAA